MLLQVLSFVLFSAYAAAQQSLYGQCGGIGWTGATTCVSGSVCSVQNPYYSQCLPGTATVSTSTIKSSSTTTTSKTTTITTSVKSSATTITTSSVKPSTTTTTSIKASSTTSAPSSTATEYFITFGDSYSQTGFDVTLTLPSCGNPLGNPTFPGYTTDNGANWIGYLVSTYNDSCVLSYNFASGGATVDSNLVAPYATTVLSLVQQVAQFKASIADHPSTTPWTSANTLFGIWIGINDVGNTWYNDNATETTLLGEIFDQYFAQVQILYDAGGRNFVFLTVPPTNLSPMFIADGNATTAGVAAEIAVWNSDLEARVSNFTATHSGVSAKVVDTIPVFTNILDTNATIAACFNADGVSCFWWNNYHPGQAIQKAVAAAVAAAEPAFF